ncbi:group II intron reverse transcriptase/maturase [Ideonella livida]|nr:group II intron reverse transcriptase/maturase [Ideonella livida]
MGLLEQALERENLQRALRQVRQNKGAPGVDGMTVDELPGHLKRHWPQIKAQLLAGGYGPQPVRKVEIPKPDGRMRVLGIPTVLDRFIQQALAQVVSRQWEPHFHPDSYGFRPGRNAHQAVRKMQAEVKAGKGWVVDIDLESFFDRVNHDRLISRLARQVPDARMLQLIRRFARAGMWDAQTGQVQTRRQGVPQGGPLSPVLANVVLDELDWTLHRRGLAFARYADDCQIMVASERAGHRVMASVTRLVEDSLRLTVNSRKSAVDRPWNRKFLGFTLNRRSKGLQVAKPALDKLKHTLRGLSRRTRGHRLEQVVQELRDTLLGWRAYFGITEVLSPLRDVDKWLRRRLRCYQWKQWGSAGYRELRKRGVTVREAWNVSKSAHGPWRISMTPALSLALPARYFASLGLPSLVPLKTA